MFKNCVGAIIGCMAIGVWVPQAGAATAVSPNISGNWLGTAAGTSYSEQDNSTGGTMARATSSGTILKAERASASVAATLVQTGNDLAIDAMLQTQSNSTISLHLTGKAGDFALWAAGVDVQADHTDQVFLAGQFDSKSKKIVANMVFYHNRDVTSVVVSLKRSPSTTLSRATAGEDGAGEAAGRADDELPFTVAGSAVGKSFTFSTNAKAAKFKSTLSGAFAPAQKTAVITFASNGEIYSVTETNGGKGLVLSGTSGSDNILLFGTSGKSSAAGTGWIYSDTQLAIFKWNVKKL